MQTTIGSGLNEPTGVAVDGTGDVFIADSGNGRVVEVPSGGTQTTVASGLMRPESVVLNTAGNLVIADMLANELFQVTSSGTQMLNDVVDGPSGLAVDSLGDLFVAEPLDNTVLEITPTGVQKTIGTGLHLPQDVAVNSAGDVFISEPFDHEVLEVTPSGTQSTVGTNLAGPAGLAVDAAGDLFIADADNQQVVEVPAPVTVTVNPVPTSTAVSAGSVSPLFTQSDTFTATISVPTGDGRTDRRDGDIFRRQHQARLRAVSAGVATLTTSVLPFGPQSITASFSGAADYLASASGIEPGSAQSIVPISGRFYPFGVAVDSQGDLFIADNGNGRLLEVTPAERRNDPDLRDRAWRRGRQCLGGRVCDRPQQQQRARVDTDGNTDHRRFRAEHARRRGGR